MNIAAFCKKLDDLFELSAGTVKPGDSLQQLPGWDSLTFMGLIAMVDEEYNFTLKPAVVLKAESVMELAKLISANSGDLPKAA